MRAVYLVPAVAMAVLLTSCMAPREKGLAPSVESADAAGYAPKAEGMQASAPAAPQAPPTVPKARANRKIIYTGELVLEVERLEESMREAQGIVARHGGYLSNLDQQGARTQRQATVTFRLPAERFETVLAELSKLGEVYATNVNAEDVTDQYVDLDARLRNLKRSEERLLELLDRTGSIAQLLEVERELTRVRGEIEQIEGGLRHLKDRISLATLTVRLNLPPEAIATVDSGSWFKNTVSRATAMLIGLYKWLAKTVTYLVILAPFHGPFVAIAWWLRRRRGPRRPKRAEPSL